MAQARHKPARRMAGPVAGQNLCSFSTLPFTLYLLENTMSVFITLNAIRSAMALGMSNVATRHASNTRVALTGSGRHEAVKQAIVNTFGVRPVQGQAAIGGEGRLCTFCLPQGFVYLQSVSGEPGMLHLTFERADSVRAAKSEPDDVAEVKADLAESVKLGMFKNKAKKMEKWIDKNHNEVCDLRDGGLKVSEITNLIASFV